MPKGEPGAADQGLDQAHSWASTYWGGALFCLVADVSIREKTQNRVGLQDALRAIVAAGGTIDQEWPISRVLAAGDQATGTSVLTSLYKEMGEEPDPVDLGLLWRQIGVHSHDGSILFDDHAPLAKIRQSITSPGTDARMH
jgi:predicted metalloprotease with PDZ domain